MSGQIEVGKWAVVYRGLPCCGSIIPPHKRMPFVVTSISLSSGPVRCQACGRVFLDGQMFAFGADGNPYYGMHIDTVKRLPDPDPIEEPREVEAPKPEEIPA